MARTKASSGTTSAQNKSTLSRKRPAEPGKKSKELKSVQEKGKRKTSLTQSAISKIVTAMQSTESAYRVLPIERLLRSILKQYRFQSQALKNFMFCVEDRQGKALAPIHHTLGGGERRRVSDRDIVNAHRRWQETACPRFDLDDISEILGDRFKIPEIPATITTQKGLVIHNPASTAENSVDALKRATAFWAEAQAARAFTKTASKKKAKQD